MKDLMRKDLLSILTIKWGHYNGVYSRYNISNKFKCYCNNCFYCNNLVSFKGVTYENY